MCRFWLLKHLENDVSCGKYCDKFRGRFFISIFFSLAGKAAEASYGTEFKSWLKKRRMKETAMSAQRRPPSDMTPLRFDLLLVGGKHWNDDLSSVRPLVV